MNIRILAPAELPLLKYFAPPDWNTDLSVMFSFHFDQPYFYPIAAELDGKLIGCANGLWNNKIGWLGNIIVLPDYRGQGIGQALTKQLVSFFSSNDCTSQILIATKMGEPIYRKLGFVTVSNYIFFKRETPFDPGPVVGVHPAVASDFPAILALDREITGEERHLLLGRFIKTALVYKQEDDLRGFYLPDLANGPIIARSNQAGMELLKYRLKQGKLTTVVPDANKFMLKYLQANGFTETGDAPRMVLHQDVTWKPEYVFSRGSGYCG